MIDKFQAMMNSALAGRKVQVAKAELEERNGQFSAPIAELASVVNQEVDANGDLKGHGVEALEVIRNRLTQASRCPEQVQKEIAARLGDSDANQARLLAESIRDGKFHTPQKPIESAESRKDRAWGTIGFPIQ